MELLFFSVLPKSLLRIRIQIRTKIKLDPDLHRSEQWIRMDITEKSRELWRLTVEGLWADSHHLDKDPDPDPHQSKKSDLIRIRIRIMVMRIRLLLK